MNGQRSHVKFKKMPSQPCAIGPGGVPRYWPNAEDLQNKRPHFKKTRPFFQPLSLPSNGRLVVRLPSALAFPSRSPSALASLLQPFSRLDLQPLAGPESSCSSGMHPQESCSTESRWMCLMPALMDMLHVGAELQPLLVPGILLPGSFLHFPTIAKSMCVP